VTRGLVALAAAAVLSGCGYHVGGHPTLLPKTVKTIAVPAFGNATPYVRLAGLLTENVTRELISRTKYNVVADPAQADAVLTGAVINFINTPTVYNPQGNRATGVQVYVVLQLTLTDRHTGKVLYSKPGAEFRERYEIATDPQQYFNESGTALQRVSRDVARSVVTAILEAF
jgi:outer membrane lipopolysaccharide assembly protein LptE/RlpB